MFYIESLPNVPLNYAALQISSMFKSACCMKGTPVTCSYLLNVAPLTAESNRPNNVLPKFINTRSSVTKSRRDTTAKLAEQDMCWGIEFRHWPEVAKEWQTRERPSGWPSAHAIEQVVDGGFHMVPVGVSDNKELRQVEWRYSFAVAEKTLAKHHLPAAARKAYIYLKLLHLHFFCDPPVISTYYLKHFFFWLLEKWPLNFWHDSKMADVLLCITDELLHAVRRHDMRHYFISDANLLADLPTTFASVTVARIRHVRYNLVASLLEVDDCVTFVGLYGRPKGRVLLAVPLGVMKEVPCSPEQFDCSRRVGLEALAYGTVDVLYHIGAQQTREEDPRVTMQLRTGLNTFVRVLFGLWRKQHRLGMRTVLGGDSLLEYVLQSLILSRLSALIICKALHFLQADAESRQLFKCDGSTVSPSDVYRRMDKSHLADDVRSKLGVTLSMLELMESDDITDNATLYSRMNDNLNNS